MATDYKSQLEALLKQQSAMPKYTARTEDQRRQQAANEYQSYYDQLRLAANQANQTSDLALQQNRDAVYDTYAKQREESAKQYADAYSQAARRQLATGMQRSSYGAQVLANLNQRGLEAQQAIADQEAKQVGNIDSQRALLAQQLADQMKQYDSGMAADVLKRMQEMETEDYERGLNNAQANNNLSMQIYNLLYQQERDKTQDAQWQKEYDENVRQFNVLHPQDTGAGGGGGGGGGGGSSYRRSSSSSSSGSTGSTGSTYNDLYAGVKAFVSSAASGSANYVSDATGGVKASSSGSYPVAYTVNAIGDKGKVVRTGR